MEKCSKICIENRELSWCQIWRQLWHRRLGSGLWLAYICAPWNILPGCFRLYDWLSLQNLVWGINHLPPVYQFIFFYFCQILMMAESPHEWQKWFLMFTRTAFYFLRAISCPEHTKPLKAIIDRSFHHGLAVWRHHNWHVTSMERAVVLSWRHIHWLFLQAQIGAKSIFGRSLVYNMREHRFPSTRHSRPIV